MVLNLRAPHRLGKACSRVGRFVFNTTAMFLMCSSRCVLERLQSVRISTDEGLSRYKRNSSFFRRSSRTSAESSTITVLHSYIVRRLARWHRFARQFKLARITPEELRDKLNAGEDILIVDLQGGLDHHKHLLAIPGAVRINPRRLEEYRDVEISPSQEVVLYCDCPGEFTSARVALALRRKGVQHVRPLAGGLRAWRDRGYPVTSEVRRLSRSVKRLHVALSPCDQGNPV
jgi:rhodanese-related sulfurtransferase